MSSHSKRTLAYGTPPAAARLDPRPFPLVVPYLTRVRMTWHRRPFTDAAGLIEYVLSAIFAADMFLMFRVAYRDNEAYVTDAKKIAAKYSECGPAPRYGPDT